MLRNGLSAGRRSLRISAGLPSFAANPSVMGGYSSQPLADLPFVCFSCQVRAYAKLKRIPKAPQRQQESFLGSIKRLEQHVRLLESRYKDLVRQEQVADETPTLEVTEEMKDKAYAALMASAPIQSFLPPLPPLLPRLPESIIPRLGASLALVEKERILVWDLVLEQIQQNGGFKGLDIPTVNKLVYLIPDDQRARLTDTILGMIEQSRVAINTFTYDLLMLSNAEVGNIEKVEVLFNELKQKQLPLTVRIYGHLLKSYADKKDVRSASAAFQEMHALGIKPNLIVYTSLIKACVAREELDTAWQIFELIKYRSTETAPDVTAITLMVHACALRGEAERAVDLFRYMTEQRNLEPDAKTYNALIHACAVRKDYFLEAWKYAIEMRNRGMKVDLWTLNLLLQACGKNGDLTRARLLMRLMMSSGSPEYQPDERSFQSLFRAYATAKLEKRKQKHQPQDAFFLGPNFGNQSLTKQDNNSLPFLQEGVLKGRKDILQEAKQVLRYIRIEKNEFYSTRILNAYMDICLTKAGNRELQKVFRYHFSPVPNFQPDPELEIFEEEFSADTDLPMGPLTASDYEKRSKTSSDASTNDTTSNPMSTSTSPATTTVSKSNESTTSNTTTSSTPPESEPKPSYDDWEPPKPKPPKNIFTFEIALEAASRRKAVKFARLVWAERMAFCETPEYWAILPSIRRRLDFIAEKLMIQILAKGGCLKEAIERLTVLENTFTWTQEDLKTVYDKALEEENLEAVHVLRRVLGLGPKRW